ncbi:S-adenosyl-L-methionine-dependent methyltransferase [Glomus cerebriforme]|uniref:S-adenosyl-L-methionine-dependent methyltransferase n=1 Tax=Glomus cerebriforme TaxID=658196 RepID=A0A397T0Q0_9GLOM|nr:S-adenosyl-L-methionine-dependent methyltransferase [Glomus cerebriforme]
MGNCFCKQKSKSKRKPKPYRMPTSTIGSPISDTHLIIGDILDYRSNDEYRFINGRKFHNVENSKYFLPCDDEEFDRLYSQHYICRNIWQQNYIAPVKERLSFGASHVLDVGCGPGTWLIEMANEFPKSHFTGIDITPVFPRENKSDNTDFMEINILEGLPFEDYSFDYVHMRFLITAFSESDWKFAINELVRVTKVGGIIEIVEDEIEPRNDGPISRLLFDAFLSDLTSRNIDFNICSRMIDLLNGIERLTDIKKEEMSIPFGKWAGRIGTLLANNNAKLFRTFKTRFLSTIGVEDDEYDKLIEAWYEELNEYKPYNVGYRFLATKK